MKFTFPYTERQKRLVEATERILWIGAGTKTGKSAALFCWLIQGLLRGEACCFCGPWFFRSRAALDSVKNLLQPFIAARLVRVNEARLQITSGGGGYLDFTSADNPNALFGGNYHRVVVDEASRCPEAIYAASLTTISGTKGKLRLAFNLELGSKNWAIRNLLRVQALSPEAREVTGENVQTFPTGGDGLVDPELIAMLRSQMPEALWRALYLAEIPSSDTSLFRNLDRVFTGAERETPEEGTDYFLGIDLARKQDWSVVTVIDDRGRVAWTDRFSQISWSLQIQRCGLWYRTFRCKRAIVDSTGLGDVVTEQLRDEGMDVTPYVFTVPSRKALIEELVLSCDNAEIRIPPSEKFRIYRQELEAMEYMLDGSTVRYAVPASMHDDALFSLALAVHGWREARGAVLGFLEVLKRVAVKGMSIVSGVFGDGNPKPLPTPKPIPRPPATTHSEGFQQWLKSGRAPACKACGNASTVFMSGLYGPQIRCNQCGSIDGVLVAPKETPGHVHRWRTIPGGQTKCDDCGEQRFEGTPPTTNGATFAQLSSRRNRFR